MTDAMRLLIIDDHPMTCAGLKSLLQACYPRAHIEAKHSADGVSGTAAQWDYIFLDMHLPGVRFPLLLEELHSHLSRVILISASPEQEIVEQARRRGVRGLLLKNADVGQILDGFRRIQTGEKVFVEFTDLASAPREGGQSLTGRQAEVYGALLSGLSNKQIARKLGISEYTVKEHVTSILGAYGARNRLELLLQQQRQAVV